METPANAIFYQFIWIVIEPVTYCGTGNNKRQSFHDCARILEKTAGVEKLFSIAGFLLGCRRLRVSDANFEKQILAHRNIDIPVKQMKKRKSCAN